MAKRLPTEVQSQTGVGAIGRPSVGAEGGPGTVVVRGSFSVGMGRWALSAHANRHRHKINLHVVARYEGAESAANLEEHSYTVTIRNVPAGRYWVKVNHVCHAPTLDLPSEGISPTEISVLIESGESTIQPDASAVSDGAQ